MIGSAGPVSSRSSSGTAVGRLQPPSLCGQAAAACGQQQSSTAGIDPAQPRHVASARSQPLLPSSCCDSPAPRCPNTAPFSDSPWVLVPKSSPSLASGSRAGLELASPGPGKEEGVVRTADAGDQHQLPLIKGCSRTAGAVGHPEGSWAPKTVAQVSQDCLSKEAAVSQSRQMTSVAPRSDNWALSL